LIEATIFKQQTSFWSKQLEKERAQIVPTLLCRICNQKIYADKSKMHSDLCQMRLEQSKIKLKNGKVFLDISTKVTEAILNLQKSQNVNSRTFTNLQSVIDNF
jgi:hypothetical protein